MSLDRIQNATEEQKARAFEWLRQRALHGGQTWFHAAVVMEELHNFNSTPRPEVALRTKAIAERALTEWAGWYDESRGGTPSEVTELREELESLWPSQRNAAESDEGQK